MKSSYLLFCLVFKALFHNSKSFLKCETNFQKLLPSVTEMYQKMDSDKTSSSLIAEFALDLLKNSDYSTNSLFSPVSISSTFELLSFGASGSTLAELQNFFRIKSADTGAKRLQQVSL